MSITEQRTYISVMWIREYKFLHYELMFSERPFNFYALFPASPAHFFSILLFRRTYVFDIHLGKWLTYTHTHANGAGVASRRQIHKYIGNKIFIQIKIFSNIFFKQVCV